jgi:hypothetical protein
MIKHAVVVDATGRANRGPVRLGELGFPPPAEERVDTRLIYATAQYARHPDDGDVYGSVIGATTAAPRGGASIAVEDRRWMVALVGMGNDAPPVDGPGFEEFAGRFFRAAAALAEVPWELCRGSDLRFAAVEGRRTVRTRILNRYVARLHAASHHDARVGTAFLEMANLRKPPATLFTPAVLSRVIRHGRDRRQPSRPGPALRRSDRPIP